MVESVVLSSTTRTRMSLALSLRCSHTSQQLPRLGYVLSRRAQISYRQAQRKVYPEFGMREKHLARRIHPFHDRGVQRLQFRLRTAGRSIAKAHRREGVRRQDLPTGLGLDPAGELLRQRNVPAKTIAQPFCSEMPQHEPQFEGAEPP